jgi:hypothetical protein
MEEGSELGSDDFQMRGVAIGKGHPVLSEQKLRISAFHRDPGQESWIGLARGVGRLSIAQAEYFYNHTGGEDVGEWMWNMKWRARIVRFRLPSDEDDDEGSESSDSDIGPVSVSLESLRLESMPSTDLSSIAGELPGDGPDLDMFSYLVVH